jgi:hypothetical protein
MKKLLFILIAGFLLSVGATAYAQWTPIYIYPDGIYLIPADPTWHIGSSTFPGDFSTSSANEICLAGDCRLVWPTGGVGAGAFSTTTEGEAYYLNDVFIGAATNTAFWYNTTTGKLYLDKNQVATTGALSIYITAASTTDTYLRIDASSTFLTTASSTATYITIASTTANYLTISSSTATYFTIAGANASDTAWLADTDTVYDPAWTLIGDLLYSTTTANTVVIGATATTTEGVLEVVGSIDFIYTAVSTDEHALEIEADAAGFGGR